MPALPSSLTENAAILTREYEWFSTVLDCRLKNFFNGEGAADSIYELPPPDLTDASAPFASLVAHYQMSSPERLILLLALAPHVLPGQLTPLTVSEDFKVHFGCLFEQNRILPTRQTVYFLLAEDRLADQFAVSRLLEPDHYLRKHQIIDFAAQPGSDSAEGALIVTPEYRTLLTTGDSYQPDYSANFPAKRITTPLSWEELILPPFVREDIEDMRTWIRAGTVLMEDWGLAKKVKKGYRALFHGPPGTGKTLTATLLGQVTDTPVYRVDLAMTISKYIGETEKNLKTLFDQGENKRWILFFDEADALFSRRVENQDANDRSANQQVAYLLQRLEEYNGLVILSSNLKQGMDEAFSRRFESIIYFPTPTAEERLKLWQNYFLTDTYLLAPDVDLEKIAEKYELTGGSIINVLKFCCIRSIGRDSRTLLRREILRGIRKELKKEGKTM